MSNWASPIVVFPKNKLLGNPQREDYVLISKKVNELQQEVLAKGRKEAKYHYIYSQRLMKCMQS